MFSGFFISEIIFSLMYSLSIIGKKRFFQCFIQETAGDGDTPRWHRARAQLVFIFRRNANGGMHAGSGGATNHQRKIQVSLFHFAGYINHFIQRRRDQAAEPDNICFFSDGRFQNFVDRHHHAEINNIVPLHPSTTPTIFFSDIVYIAFTVASKIFCIPFSSSAFRLNSRFTAIIIIQFSCSIKG